MSKSTLNLILDCKYGDKAPGCATLSLRGCYYNEATCCQSCPERALTIEGNLLIEVFSRKSNIFIIITIKKII